MSRSYEAQYDAERETVFASSQEEADEMAKGFVRMYRDIEEGSLVASTEDFHVGQMVQLPEGEQGQVERLDEDDNIVYVRVPLPSGETDLVDIDPGDLTPLEATG